MNAEADLAAWREAVKFGLAPLDAAALSRIVRYRRDMLLDGTIVDERTRRY